MGWTDAGTPSRGRLGYRFPRVRRDRLVHAAPPPLEVVPLIHYVGVGMSSFAGRAGTLILREVPNPAPNDGRTLFSYSRALAGFLLTGRGMCGRMCLNWRPAEGSGR